MKHKCTAYRIVDANECGSQAKYEVKFDECHISYVCGVHARAYTSKSLFPLVKTEAKNAE